ncbi:RNA polymerase sigma factor [Flavobacterium sp. JP2137]|uniref:RNA polymerase sigma factor n=1 Tax=Flavobacterium sp. JP2137 TaxID=3414510 RepID=UPI003D2FFADC
MDTKNNQNIDSLIALCKLGNAKAQNKIYSKFYKAMYTVAFRIVNDKILVEDILQESFLNAFLSIDQYKNEASFGSWLKKIVINKCLDVLKQRQKIILEDISTVLHTLVDENIREDNYEAEQIKTSQLLEVIYSLRGKSKILMILFFIKGYSKQEICDVMNISMPNFHTILFRAKKDLKEKMRNSPEIVMSNNGSADLD